MARASSALSYSSVRAYLECPLRWRFLYIDGLREAPKGYFSFGRTVHSVLEEMLKPFVVPDGQRIGGPRAQTTLDGWSLRPGGAATALLPLSEVQALYERKWVSEGYTSPDEEARYRALGLEMLHGFWRTLSLAPPRPIAVEEHLEAIWDGIPIHGYVDRIDRTENGGLEILDYKTSRELSQDDAKGSDQLALYQVLVERNFSAPVEALTLYHMRALRPLTVPPKGAGELTELQGRVSYARDGIRSGAYDPTPGRHCGRCEFQERCPEFREVPVGDRARLAELVDRFAELRAAEARLEGELRTTAQALHEAATVLGVHRIPGSDRVARRRRESDVRAVTPPSGPAASPSPLIPGPPTGNPSGTEATPGSPDRPTAGPPTERPAGRSIPRWYWELESKGAPRRPSGRPEASPGSDDVPST